MIRILEIPITIAVTGISFNSDAIKLESGRRLVAWEFTTPTYTNNQTTTVTIVSPAGHNLLASSAIARTTANVKLCAETEKAPLFSGSYINLTLDGAAGGSTAYTMTVILYTEDAEEGSLILPTGFVTALSFKTQADALLNQASPVQNTWYPVLQAYNVKLFGIHVLVATTTETLGVRITADGKVMLGSAACTNDTEYRVIPNCISTGSNLSVTSSTIYNGNELEAQNFLFEVRKTTAAGTGNIQACVSYATRGV